MKKSREFRPSLQSLEDRVALSFSFSNFFNSILGLGNNNSSSHKPHPPVVHKPHVVTNITPAFVYAHMHWAAQNHYVVMGNSVVKM